MGTWRDEGWVSGCAVICEAALCSEAIARALGDLPAAAYWRERAEEAALDAFQVVGGAGAVGAA